MTSTIVDIASWNPIPKGDGSVGPLATLKQDIGITFSKVFKSLSLAKFDVRNDPYEHVASNNKQMAIIGVSISLKCNLLSRIFRDVVLQWYMGLPRASISNYQKFGNKLVH